MNNEVEGQLSSKDIVELMKFLPHRYPFLLVDRIVNINKDNSAVGIKNVTFNEPHFAGHFPDFPLMPGVLMLEGMAQTAGAICAMNQISPHGNSVYLMTIDNARFRKPVVPGDRLEYHVFKSKHRPPDIWKFSCYAKVDGCDVAEAQIGAMIVRKNKGTE